MLRLLKIAIVLGAVHFIWTQWRDTPPAQTNVIAAEEKVVTEEDIDRLASQVESGEVMMYVTETCPYCHQFDGWLTQHHFTFSKCDIEKDRTCYADYLVYHASGTPHTVVRRNGKVRHISGYDAAEFLDALEATSS